MTSMSETKSLIMILLIVARILFTWFDRIWCIQRTKCILAEQMRLYSGSRPRSIRQYSDVFMFLPPKTKTVTL